MSNAVVCGGKSTVQSRQFELRQTQSTITTAILLLVIGCCDAQALSLFRWGGPPSPVVEEAIRADMTVGRLQFLGWSLKYKIIGRERKKVDGQVYYYCDYRATAEITRGNKFVKPGEKSEHEGTVVLFKKGEKWFRVVLRDNAH